jgi:hypothetical protein
MSDTVKNEWQVVLFLLDHTKATDEVGTREVFNVSYVLSSSVLYFRLDLNHNEISPGVCICLPPTLI